MKIFQIVGGICFHDATAEHPTLLSTVGKYPPDVLFVEAPDNVFEGWGYVNGTFVQPTPPPGWAYDEKTGTFYEIGTPPPSEINDPLNPVWDAIAAAIREGVNSIVSE